MLEAFVIIAVGIGLFYGGIKFQSKTKNLLDNGIKTEGIVFDIVESNMINDLAYYPVIRFLTSEKVWITEEYNVGTTAFLFKKGQEVSVIYNPDNPKEFVVKSETSIVVPKLLIIAGILILAIGLYKLYI